MVLCSHGHLALLSLQLVPIKGLHKHLDGSQRSSPPQHQLRHVYSVATRSILSHSTLEHEADRTGSNAAFRCFRCPRCRDPLYSRHRLALPCPRCFREVLVHPVTTQIFRRLELVSGGRDTVRISCSDHLRSLWAILSRSSWFPITSRISLDQQASTFFIYSIFFHFFFSQNIKPLFLLFQKNQGLPWVQALLADPKIRKYVQELQPLL